MDPIQAITIVAVVALMGGFTFALIVLCVLHGGRARDPEDDDGPWMEGPVECRVCGYKQHSVAPASTELKNLECSRCGCLTCDLVTTD